MTLADKLKELRKNKNVSQEKLGEYLGVSFQAISKWETGVTSPDISLLPDIARYYGITVDELLGVEQIDEWAYIDDCCEKSAQLQAQGKKSEIIQVWRDAYKKMPNNPEVKDYLLGAYYDAGKIEYKNEIIELGTELYTLHEYGNYKANAVSTVAKTYYAAGNAEKAIEWARKAHSVRYFKEFLCMQIYEDPDVLTTDFSVANYVYIESLFYMAMRLFEMKVCKPGEDYTQKVCKTVTEIYETVFPDDDMGYDFLYKLSILHLCIAEKESEIGKNEAVVKKHLTRAVECAIKSMSVKAHILDHPLICGVDVGSSPEKYGQTVNEVKREMRKEVFLDYHSRPWFISLEAGLAKATV